jgi:hypothetical protein
MPPTGTTPLQYLTRLLAAFVRQNGGEIRIKNKHIREVMEVEARQALFEDEDTKKDEIVLRFGSKHSAIYPIEPECRASAQPATPTQPITAQTQPGSTPAQVRKAFTDADLLKAENAIKRLRNVNAIRKSQSPIAQI